MEISEIHDLLHTDRKVYKTHLKELNCLLGGGIPEDSLTVVTSGVSVGKSMLAQNLFTSIYLQSSDINAIAFTLESSKYDFLKRVFSSVSATKQNEVFDAIKSKPDLEKTLEFLFNRLLLSTKSNVCYIRDLLENGNNKYSCILIDGLYLIDDLYTNSQKLNEFLRFLRRYASERKVPIIITVPLKRSNYKNEDMDLSSCVGKAFICNSNIILCMTREENADNGKIKILKNSYGSLGDFDFKFLPEYAYITDCNQKGKITLLNDLKQYI